MRKRNHHRFICFVTCDQVSLMRCNIRSVNSTLRSVRDLNDLYGWNELNMPLTDRYNAGVLDNPQHNNRRTVRQRTAEGTKEHRNSEDRNAPITAVENQPITASIGTLVNSDSISSVWLHSSVGRTSHRYRGGHWFESR